MKDETLLPCPFCGSTECEAFAQDEEDCPYQSAIVRCFNCDAQSAQMVGKDKIIQAIAAWNKRPATQSGNSAQPVTVPAGYVLVPVEPTPEMMMHKSGCQHHAWNDQDCPMRETRRLVWSHMLAAAPKGV
ncbi:MAG: Lar family restriction alleviation protein [Enterobacteriaceae bacterium]|nr:Lar family restriction alleviation protein [Enterobacteriaceae bacterium]